ncbi:cytochrome-c peroxidase [Nitrospirillum sp. BR 11828]|uniref:cytochrome-c peroxidase n=1 Tax=Nitrospirillum sp. BR 11828 TaxID=3104325 RepID=UPI002ACAF434|nr:cytochrome c peroxidase [Nitrospirillum sp. BR 11828]MDZ5649642.1 cytochrome c peroxidase [Nitrospirillum sp. BR 11828]
MPTTTPAQGMSREEARRQAAALAEVGRQLFFDPRLSASGTLACASCHDPAHAFGPPDGAAVRLGGADGQTPGLRAVPSLMYLQDVPPFAQHYRTSEDEGDESVDNGPTGGLTWDGRVDSQREQARVPLFSPFEMGNTDPADLGARLEKAGYGAQLRAAVGLGNGVMRGGAGGAELVDLALHALDVFQQDGALFHPYTSKYDAYLAGKATLTDEERRGLEAFEDPARGNCASCHVSRPGLDGTPPHFTDYGLIALGVPRNRDIPANADPSYFDQGLCGPLRTDFTGVADYCGRFRTPTLRNVALRQVFMHNGVFHTLRQVMEFYAERDTDPGKWYPRGPDGSVMKFDDIAAAAQGTVAGGGVAEAVNQEPPFGRRPGDAPALNAREIQDIIAFLGTLTDGWSAKKTAGR